MPSSTPGEQWRVGARIALLQDSTDFVIVVVGRELVQTNAVVSRYAAIFRSSG